MHTQNVNIKTAAQESSRKMGGVKTVLMTFFIPSHNAVYGWALQRNGEWFTEYGHQTLEAVRRLYPDTILMAFSDVQQKPDVGFRRQWEEITSDRYIAQMESLSLMDWCQGNGGETFKSMEYSGGDITAIYARYEGRFFECRDLFSLTHHDLIGSIIARFCLDGPDADCHC